MPAYLSRVLYWGYVYAANTIGPGQIPAKWSPEYEGMINIYHLEPVHVLAKEKFCEEVGGRLGRKNPQKSI